MLRSAIPGVASVTNPRPAYGGVDPESLDSARQRAAMEIRTRYRAVTAEDFEFLVGEASSRVGRTICVAPTAPTDAIRVHVLPRVAPADRKLTYEELTPAEDLLAEIGSYLDGRRVIGTTVHLLPVRLRGVSVVVNLQAEPRADLHRVEEEVLQALYTYLNPLVGGDATGPADGWPFGRMLNQGELYQIVHAVDGVEFVKILRVYETELRTGQQAPQPAGTHIALEADELLASGTHVVKADHPPGDMTAATGSRSTAPGRSPASSPIRARGSRWCARSRRRASTRVRRPRRIAAICEMDCPASTATTTSRCGSSARSSRCWIRS